MIIGRGRSRLGRRGATPATQGCAVTRQWEGILTEFKIPLDERALEPIDVG